MMRDHLDNAEQAGASDSYLRLEPFTHRSTDGPRTPTLRFTRYAGSSQEDFPDFTIVDAYKRYMHAPPLPVHGLPGETRLGWHL